VNIVRTLQERGFDSETVSKLGAAFDTTWQVLKTSNPSLAKGPMTAPTREAIAKYILDMGADGETDVNKLVNGAITRLRL
jgi:hypothetical protein